MQYDIKNFLKIDLTEIIKNHLSIVETFDNIEESFDIKDPYKFIQNLDKYILHTIEEVIEYFDSVYTMKDEVVDIFNYLLSNAAILYKVRGRIKIVDFDNQKFVNEQDINVLLLEIISNLIAIRRLFPERKWHNNETIKEVSDEILEIAQIHIINAIYVLFLICSNYFYLELSPETLIEKSKIKAESIVSNYKLDKEKG